ncbi:MAG: FAD-dependent monooxygenase, partial [Rubrobacter sp.]|nr:FAD-dependent monooxygenase [Rubrobacter sp.]
MTEKYDIGVVGAGYVGLVTGACLARVGHRVTCVDRDEGRIAELREGRVPIYEPGLEELVERLSGGKLPEERSLFFRGPEEFQEVVGSSDVLFIAVDTPQGDDGAADLSSVAEVARRIGQSLANSGTAR